MAAAQKKHRDAKRSYMQAIKMTRGCQDCGYNSFADALEFDHISDDKLLNLAQMWSRSYAVIDAEIAKCDVVCANCHRVRTARRRGTMEVHTI